MCLNFLSDSHFLSRSGFLSRHFLSRRHFLKHRPRSGLLFRRPLSEL